MIKTILWDIDGTILNFKAAESVAIKKCFVELGMGECTDEQVARYSKINQKYWKMLERGEITKPKLLNERFREFFETEEINFSDFDEFNKIYQVRLGDTIVFNDNAYDLIKSFKGKVKQYAVTNGTFTAQDIKLKNSGLYELFDDVFISEKIGFEKPDINFFNIVFKKTGIKNLQETVIVGDSLTGDIKGGNNAGILCCWYNPSNELPPKDLKIDFNIQNLNKLAEIIK